MNGVDPYPPRKRAIENPLENNSQTNIFVSARSPLREKPAEDQYQKVGAISNRDNNNT